MTNLVLYHKDCSDGFGAAYAAWRKFGPDAHYEPLRHGDLPDLSAVDTLYFLDISPKPDMLADIIREVGHVVIIDHHKSAQVDLQGAPTGVEVHFDMAHSAAVLAWNYFHPTTEMPWLMAFVEDRDMWWHKLPHSAEVNAAIRSYPLDDLLRWDTWAQSLYWKDKLIDEGSVVLRTERGAYRRSMREVQWFSIGGLRVPIINTTVGGNDAANELLNNLGVRVAGYYFDRGDGKRQFGLRSDGSIDVSELAAIYGGGGHRAAAGFQVLQEEGRLLHG